MAELIFAFCRINFLDLFTKTLKETSKTEMEFLQLIDLLFPMIAKKGELKEEVCGN
jgi:hypothetical protein